MKSMTAEGGFGEGSFNTLAQSGKPELSKQVIKKQIIVNGEGADLSNSNVLQGRAKKKTITQTLMLSLIDVANKKKNPEQAVSYWNTYHCQGQICTSGGRLFGKYCKNRFCTLCCGIRKAEIINKYLPEILKWEDPHFVTLTAKSVSAKHLKKRIYDTKRAFRILTNRNKKRNQKGKAVKLIGVKSLECNFNPIKRTYNPHFHLIVPNKEIADLLICEWLSLWTKNGTPKYCHLVKKSCLHSAKVKNPEDCLIEIVKYFSKVFTEPDPKRKSSKKTSAFVYLSAMDNIIGAMKGHRIFDRFGFNLTNGTNKREAKTTPLIQYKNWEFDLSKRDWVDPETSQTLSGYKPTRELLAILENNIDTVLE